MIFARPGRVIWRVAGKAGNLRSSAEVLEPLWDSAAARLDVSRCESAVMFADVSIPSRHSPERSGFHRLRRAGAARFASRRRPRDPGGAAQPLRFERARAAPTRSEHRSVHGVPILQPPSSSPSGPSVTPEARKRSSADWRTILRRRTGYSAAHPETS